MHLAQKSLGINETDVIRPLLTESRILARDARKVKKRLQGKGLGVAYRLHAASPGLAPSVPEFRPAGRRRPGARPRTLLPV